MPVLGTAGLSFSLVASTPAAVGRITPAPATSALVGQPRMEEEQNPEVSLATFRVPDQDSVGPQQPVTHPIMVTQGACGAQTSIFLRTRQRSAGQLIRHHRSDSASTSRAQVQAVVKCRAGHFLWLPARWIRLD